MASSLATHQFAGVSAQFKCVRARRRRGDIRDNPLPMAAATRAIFLRRVRPERAPGSRSIAPRARFPGTWLTMPTSFLGPPSRARTSSCRNVQVRDQTGKIPRAHGTARMLNTDGSRLARRERALAGHATVRRAELRAAFARCPHDRARRPRASTGRPARPAAAPVSRLDIGPAPRLLQHKNRPTAHRCFPRILCCPRRPRGMPYTADLLAADRLHLHRGCPGPRPAVLTSSAPPRRARQAWPAGDDHLRYDQYKGAWDTSVRRGAQTRAG